MLTLPEPNALIKATETEPKMLIIYGPPKVGKTTMFAKLPNSLLIDIDTGGTGSDYVDACKVKIKTIPEWNALIAALKKTPDKYQYIVVDTVDILQEWAEVLATTYYRSLPIAKTFSGQSCLELPMGSGYGYLRNQLSKLIGEIRFATNAKLILGAHVGDSKITDDGKDVTVKDLDLIGKCKTIVASAADAIGHVTRTKDKLQISFKTSESLACGSRCEHLKGRVFIWESWSQIYPSLATSVATTVTAKPTDPATTENAGS